MRSRLRHVLGLGLDAFLHRAENVRLPLADLLLQCVQGILSYSVQRTHNGATDHFVSLNNHRISGCEGNRLPSPSAPSSFQTILQTTSVAEDLLGPNVQLSSAAQSCPCRLELLLALSNFALELGNRAAAPPSA